MISSSETFLLDLIVKRIKVNRVSLFENLYFHVFIVFSFFSVNDCLPIKFWISFWRLSHVLYQLSAYVDWGLVYWDDWNSWRNYIDTNLHAPEESFQRTPSLPNAKVLLQNSIWVPCRPILDNLSWFSSPHSNLYPVDLTFVRVAKNHKKYIESNIKNTIKNNCKPAAIFVS